MTNLQTGHAELPARDATWFEQVAASVNGDTEMGLIGRHFNATVSFTFGTQRNDLVIHQGKIVDLRHGKKFDWRVDFGFRAPDEIWDRFFQKPAPPIFHSVFAMIMREPDFHLEGDTLVLAQHMRALSRLLDIMQTEGQPK